MKQLNAIIYLTAMLSLSGCITPHPAISLLLTAINGIATSSDEKPDSITVEQLLAQARGENTSPNETNVEPISADTTLSYSVPVDAKTVDKAQMRKFTELALNLRSKGVLKVKIIAGVSANDGDLIAAFNAERYRHSIIEIMMQNGLAVAVISDPHRSLEYIDIVAVTEGTTGRA